MNNRDLAAFLLGEKDTRPPYETDHRSLLFPGKVSGYNNAFSYAVPGILGGGAWDTMGDIVKGNRVSTDEIKHSANEAAGAAMMGSVPFGVPAGALRSGAAKPQAPAPRDLDSLGYYSAALEAAKAWPQGKGTPEQALMWLQKSGTKQAEIDATGLSSALQGRPSVTRDELVKHLTDNRVDVRETAYSSKLQETRNRIAREAFEADYDQLREHNQRIVDQQMSGNSYPEGTKWSAYSLDPSNPTYRETVLHLPVERRMGFDRYQQAYRDRFPNAHDVSDAEVRGFYDRGVEIPGAGQTITQKPDVMFSSGHFSEPNIIGHMQTSLNKHEGRPVYTIDQIQSDWGQKLRDGGVRDEAKIAELSRRYSAAFEAWTPYDEAMKTAGTNGFQQRLTDPAFMPDKGQEWKAAAASAWNDYRLLKAELDTAEASAAGHPLVNTTDQWTNTTLRRALQQAINAEADHIAIPSGNTVLGYNPGDAHGMNAFYGDIVPKNLAAILAKLDKTGMTGRQVDQLETPSGPKGAGFSLFDITPKMRDEARRGLPLFANPPTSALAALLLGQEQQE